MGGIKVGKHPQQTCTIEQLKSKNRPGGSVEHDWGARIIKTIKGVDLLRMVVYQYPKNHWTLLLRGLDVYSRGLGSPNHQFWDPMILRVQSISESVMIPCQRSSKRHSAAPKKDNANPLPVERSLPHLPHSKTYFSVSIQHHEFPCFLNPAYIEIKQTNEKHVAKGSSQRKPIQIFLSYPPLY